MVISESFRVEGIIPVRMKSEKTIWAAFAGAATGKDKRQNRLGFSADVKQWLRTIYRDVVVAVAYNQGRVGRLRVRERCLLRGRAEGAWVSAL
jgi:hypothetical protein